MSSKRPRFIVSTSEYTIGTNYKNKEAAVDAARQYLDYNEFADDVVVSKMVKVVSR